MPVQGKSIAAQKSIPDGNETLHPAHLWAKRFGIWQEGLPWPVNVRLRCAEEGYSLVTALCKPDGWDYATGWPLSRKSIEAVHLVHINADGSPREVRLGNTTTNKHSYGLMSDCFSLISGPKSVKIASQDGIISVCEGLKDALAIFSEKGHTVLAMDRHGTAFRNPEATVGISCFSGQGTVSLYGPTETRRDGKQQA